MLSRIGLLEGGGLWLFRCLAAKMAFLDNNITHNMSLKGPWALLRAQLLPSATQNNCLPFLANLGCIATRRRQWHPTPVLLPGKSHGWRSLVGYSPRGREESDMTEQLHFLFSPSCVGEGNGNPLQCSCLENPRDGGAWWAAVYGVTQSQTRLKWLSSSSSSSKS